MIIMKGVITSETFVILQKWCMILYRTPEISSSQIKQDLYDANAVDHRNSQKS